MVDVQKLKQMYDAGGLDSLLADPKLKLNVNHIKDEINQADPNQQKALKDFLRSLLDEMDAKVEELTAQMTDQKQVIERGKQNSDACLAYLNTPRGDKKE